MFSLLTLIKKCFKVIFPFSYLNSINNNKNNLKNIHFVCISGNIFIPTTTLSINQTKYDNVENLFSRKTKHIHEFISNKANNNNTQVYNT